MSKLVQEFLGPGYLWKGIKPGYTVDEWDLHERLLVSKEKDCIILRIFSNLDSPLVVKRFHIRIEDAKQLSDLLSELIGETA